MIRSDNHVHSSFSADSNTSMQAIIQRAIKLGLSSVCFTDHIDYGFPSDYYNIEFLFSVNDYFETIQKFSEEEPSIQLRTGVELGLKQDSAKEILALPKKYSFDFVIGSTHLVNNLDPYYEEYWEKYGEENGISLYYETTYNNILMNFDFDVYGHIDYIIRYCPSVRKAQKSGSQNEHFYQYIMEKNAEILDEILLALIHSGKGIEVNTAGLKYGLGHPNPHEKIISRYHKLGGTILTVGSDAHETKHLAFSFEELPKLLFECGFKHYTEFHKRCPIEIPLT